MEKYQRASGGLRRPKSRKLRTQMELQEKKHRLAAEEAAGTEELLFEKAGFLEPESEMEKTYKITQREIADSVDVGTKTKRFNLKLDKFGPYHCDYSVSGNYLLLGGRKGHLASFNWKTGELESETSVNETVRAVKYLQNDHQFFAAAQKKYTFIYDSNGMEVHKLKHHIEATHLEYLPYHYLLVTAGTTGFLKYQDVSTGQLVSEIRSKLGPTSALTQNRHNAVVHAGHHNGTVTLWTPTMHTPVVKMLCSRGPVRALAIDRSGNYMATAGTDRTVKIWDLRNYQELETYFAPTPASSLAISDTGLLAVGWGPHVHVWKDVLTRTGPKVSHPYLTHLLAGEQVENVRFAPFEDVLGVGYSTGFESMIVPGAGEANLDAMEANPYMHATRSARRETEVHALLEKLQPDMITLNPNFIGNVDTRSHFQRLSAAQAEEEERKAEKAKLEVPKPQPGAKTGKNQTAMKEFQRKKNKNIVDERTKRLEHAWELEKKARERASRIENGLELEPENTTGAALRRFE